MDPRLTSLLKLQEVLSVQRKLELQYEEIPKRKNEIQTFLKNLEDETQAAEEQYKQYEIEQNNVEIELRQGQEDRVKKEAQLMTIKNNKEYQAMLTEIETLDRRNSRNEERLIELIDAVEKQRDILQEKKNELGKRRSDFQSELDELEKTVKGLTQKVEAARQETERIKERVDPVLFQRFVRVFHGKQGIAVATANGGYCGACSIRLTPRLIQLAKRGQDIVVCEGCQRFLYWDHSLDEDQLDAL
ncbi:MAG: zinc ribbon domain-containing protein [Candidatus Hinthialibacter sp.]